MAKHLFVKFACWFGTAAIVLLTYDIVLICTAIAC